MKKIGLALAMLSVFGLIGMVGATSVPVTATYYSVYQPATCVFGTYDGVNSPAAAVTLTPAGAPLYVQNLGSSDSNLVPSTMSVTVAFNDYGLGAGANGGWYQGSTWESGISTQWSSTEQVGPYDLQALSLFDQGPAYAALASGTGIWSPITFSVVGGTTLPAGPYNQDILLTGSC